MLSDQRFIALDAQAKARLSQRRKCVVCSALRLSHETFPFTQRTPLCAGWCKSIFPNDRKAEQKLYKTVVRAVDPALCREHFHPRCFTDKHELRAYAVPTLPKGNTTAAVMKLLIKAKAELAKILPGNFIPREDTWLRIERGASLVKKAEPAPYVVRSPKRNRCSDLPMNNGVPKEESHIYASTSRCDNEIKKEEADDDLQDWCNAAGAMPLATSSEGNTRAKGPPPKRRSRRPMNSSLPSIEKSVDSVDANEEKVTTRSGRLVKRKNFDAYDAPQPLSGGQAKRMKGVRAASSMTAQPRLAPGSINPITGEITPYVDEDVKPDISQLNAVTAAGPNTMVVVKKEEEEEDGYPGESFDKESFGDWKDFEKKRQLIDHIAHDHCYYA